MNHHALQRRTLIQAALASALIPGAAFAQVAFENVKLLNGFPPGGTSDVMTRRIADKLRGVYGTNVVVENKPGAGGQIGVTTLRDSPADGSVMLLTPASMVSIYPSTYPKLPYKPLEDTTAVSLACTFQHGFGVGPAVPDSVKNINDFLTWAKANPSKANYGSPGAGSMPHLIAAFINLRTKGNLNHAPYRGSAPGIQDLLGGQISAMSSPIGDYLPHLKSGKLRLLAVSGDARSGFAPDVPTLKEQGHDIAVREWYGIFMPGKARPEAVNRASLAIQTALKDPALVQAMTTFGMEVETSTPQALTDRLKRDIAEWAPRVKEIGFSAES